MYADFPFYTEQFLGSSIAEPDFPRLSFRASAFLDYYTMGKSKKSPNLHELKMACCAIAEQYQIIEAANKVVSQSVSDSGAKKSETVGSYSVSYATGEESTRNALSASGGANAQLSKTAQLYLIGTGLLYRGGRNVCPPCCDHL